MQKQRICLTTYTAWMAERMSGIKSVILSTYAKAKKKQLRSKAPPQRKKDLIYLNWIS